MKNFILCLLIVTGTIAAQVSVAAQTALTEDQKIENLIRYVAGIQNAKFVRNGQEFPPAKAAEHLRKKLKRDKAKISCARDFIRVAGTISNTSGKPYMIKFSDGRTAKLGDLLLAELARLEQL